MKQWAEATRKWRKPLTVSGADIGASDPGREAVAGQSKTHLSLESIMASGVTSFHCFHEELTNDL